MAKSDLKSLTLAELQQEIQRRKQMSGKVIAKLQRKRNTIARRRAKLDAEIAAIEKEIAGLGGDVPDAPKKRGPKPGSKRAKKSTKKASTKAPKTASTKKKTTRKRPSNKMSLQEAIAGVLKTDTPTKVADIVKGVIANGYKTSSANFRTIVSQTLSKTDDFKSVGRGLYVKKG